MGRLPTSIALGLAICFLLAAPAYANHTHVGSSVRVVHGSNDVATYLSLDPTSGSPFTACTGTVCAQTVPMNARDFNRFVRWCGSATQSVIIPVGAFNAGVNCPGSSTWFIRVAAALNDCSGAACETTTHSDPVQVNVTAVKQ